MPRPTDAVLLQRYEEWDPHGDVTIDQFCRRNAVSRSDLYRVLNNNDVIPKSRRPSEEMISIQEIAKRLEGIELAVKELLSRTEPGKR